ncbi:MAG: hypothetical protein ACXWNK_07775 [Vulcanimicrobiaceae bacterium]
MSAKTFVLSVALLLCLGAPGDAETSQSNSVRNIAIPNVSVAPPIDGTLSSEYWKGAATAYLTYDLRNHQPATEPTIVYLMTDGAYLYVGVDAKQSIPVRATEHTNGIGPDTDDEFHVSLWPNGTSGFRYQFTATSIGTHYQYSTENNSYEPEWWSVGKIVRGGFTITMKIPLAVMHGTGKSQWRMQLTRYMPVTNDTFVWNYGGAQQSFNDVNYAGWLRGLPSLSGVRPKPRVGVYALGSLASPAAGGSASRAGADFSIPVIPGTAFVGTVHPDFSDVEVDQQSIAPSAFRRMFSEVRPFFTQGANFYNYPNGTCLSCPGIIEFYTPNIPTPRSGYAIEGERGLFNYDMLDAQGASRGDAAQSVNYVSPNQQFAIDGQRSSVNTPAYHDDVVGFNISYNNLKNFTQYVRYADDSGTNVLVGSQGQRYEIGSDYYQPDGTSISVALRKVGAYFNPIDGLVQHPDIAGYAVSLYKPFKYSPEAEFTEFDISGSLDRYHDHTGALDQANNGLSFNFNTRTLFRLTVSTGSSYLRLSPASFAPVTQQGVQLGYNLNGSLPTSIGFNTGRFGPGLLTSWTRSTTTRVGTRGSLTVEVDDTDQRADSGTRYEQWLERLSFAYQNSADQSMAIGVRRIIGTPPELSTIPVYQAAWNVSAALHRKVPGGEIYLVYGDAAALSTDPRVIVKWIRYVGADKGA